MTYQLKSSFFAIALIAFRFVGLTPLLYTARAGRLHRRLLPLTGWVVRE
jgi:hypothetical protein